MRLKYYLVSLKQIRKNKKTNVRQMRYNGSFVFVVIFVISIMLLCFAIYFKTLRPTLKSLCESNAKSLALKCSSSAVEEAIKDIKYEDLVNITKDNNGKINTLSANVKTMNDLSNRVVITTQNEFEKTDNNYIKIPLGSFVGLNFFGGSGVKVKVKTLPIGTTKAELKSSFDSAGINQTRHRISIVITTEIKTIAPFFSDTQNFVNEIAIAETVIVGDSPTTYYDIDGIKDINTLIE